MNWWFAPTSFIIRKNKIFSYIKRMTDDIIEETKEKIIEEIDEELTEEQKFWKRKLTKQEELMIEKLMEQNPLCDYFYAETIVRCPPSVMERIIQQKKEGKLPKMEEAKGGILKTGKVEDPEVEKVEDLNN